MQEIYPQIEPPKNSFNLRDIILVLATVVGTIIGAIILGTTHIIGFDWIVAILVGIMLGVMIFCIWYTFRTRQRLQERYDRDHAAFKDEWQTFKQVWQSYFNNEQDRLDKWALSYAADREKEYQQRYEELKRQCMEAIHDAELRMDAAIKSAQSLFSSAVESERYAVELYGRQLIHAQEQMLALEERLKREPHPDTVDQLSEVETPSA